MRLLCDIGNTRIKWAIEEAGSMLASGALQHSEFNAENGLEVDLPITALRSVWVSCVGPQSSFDALEQWCRQKLSLAVNRVSVTSQAIGIRNAYTDLERLGVDRWVAAIGARQIKSKGAVIVIDAGTAATIDILDANDVYQGGAILPGLSLMHDSLVNRTTGIDSQRSSLPIVVGKTTAECVNSGIHFGLIGAVEKVTKEMQKNLPRKATLIITGGDSKLINRYTNLEMQHIDNLVLIGLRALADAGES